MSQSFKGGEPMGPMEMLEGSDLEEKIKAEFEEGADEVRITNPPKGVPLAEYVEKSKAAKAPPRPLITLEMLNDKLDTLIRRFDTIFGESVLVNGKWVDLNKNA